MSELDEIDHGLRVIMWMAVVQFALNLIVLVLI
jgi:hypothetical protein